MTALRRAALRVDGVRRARLAGGLLAYEKDSCSPGRPCRCVALIHGLGDSALTWDKILRAPRASEPGRKLLAVDMPGTDGSDAPADPSGFAIRTQAKTLRTALESECSDWTLVANSLGGWTSLRLALDWPSGIRGLILLDPAGISDPSGLAEQSARSLIAPTPEGLKEFSRRASYRGREIPERALISAAAAIRARHTSQVVSALRRDDLLDGRLSALKIPVRLVWGAADGIIPLEVGRRMHRLIKGSRLDVIRGCGHLPQQECPEAVLPLVFPERIE